MSAAEDDDPFAILLGSSLPVSLLADNSAGQATAAASSGGSRTDGAADSAAGTSTFPPAVAMESNRAKRDQFLMQMNSFLDNFESDMTGPGIWPPAAVADADHSRTEASHSQFPANVSSPFPSSAVNKSHGSVVLTPVAPAQSSSPRKGSKELDEGLDSLLNFLGSGTTSSATRASVLVNDTAGISGSGSSSLDLFAPPPTHRSRQNLFDDDDDDDVGTEGVGSGGAGNTFTSAPPPLASAPAAPQPPPNVAIGKDGEAKASSKATGSRGSIDLERARRRTIMLTQGQQQQQQLQEQCESRSSTPVEPSTAGMPSEDRNRTSPSSMVSSQQHDADPLATTSGDSSVGGAFASTSATSYFNDAILRQRGPPQLVSAPAPPGGASGNFGGLSENLMERASAVVDAARSGATSLFQQASARGDTDGDGLQSWDQQQGSFFTTRGNYDVTFGEGRLGFMLVKAEDESGVVCRVHPGTMAAHMNVRVGDVLIGINRRRYKTYEEVMAVLPHADRPVLATFLRSDPPPPLPNGTFESGTLLGGDPAGQSMEGPLGWLSNLDLFKRRQSSSSCGAAMDVPERSGSWRVSGDDLLRRRPDFHGAVVESFGGIFSWSLYGTSDETEAGGETYTEYVMRCQWGPTHDSMSPWMVARRYREFDALDKDLRETFPHLRTHFPSLPPKELFKTNAEVVARRKVGLEQYMTFLVTNMPDVLCCEHMDRFLTISERIMQIRAERRGAVKESASRPRLSPLHPMTSEEAYRAFRNSSTSLAPLGSVGLRALEELIQDFASAVHNLPHAADPRHDPELLSKLDLCQNAWPVLKATAARIEEVPDGMDLLPRVVQADENLDLAMKTLQLACQTSKGLQ